MFGMGFAEIVVIAIVALLFIGPDKLPEAAKKISQGIRDLRKHSSDIKETIDQDTELGDAVRELKSALRGDPYYEMRPRPSDPIGHPDAEDDADNEDDTGDTGDGDNDSSGEPATSSDRPPQDDAPTNKATHTKIESDSTSKPPGASPDDA